VPVHCFGQVLGARFVTKTPFRVRRPTATHDFRHKPNPRPVSGLRGTLVSKTWPMCQASRAHGQTNFVTKISFDRVKYHKAHSKRATGAHLSEVGAQDQVFFDADFISQRDNGTCAPCNTAWAYMSVNVGPTSFVANPPQVRFLAYVASWSARRGLCVRHHGPTVNSFSSQNFA
jgi:hypothetical protein